MCENLTNPAKKKLINNQQPALLCERQSLNSCVSSQALHFFTGLGALVSPLVADPFLADDNCVLAANSTANSTFSLQHLRSSLVANGATLPNISQYPLHTQGVVLTQVSYAFWIMALINVSPNNDCLYSSNSLTIPILN